jgi:O-antigen/teichoic acid export membrane protein
MSLKSRIEEGSRLLGLTRSVTESLLFRLTGMLLFFFLQLVVSRFLGPKGFGDYMFIEILISIVIVFSLFGMDAAVRRVVPQALAEKDNSSALGFILFSYKSINIASVVISGLILTCFIFNSFKGRESFNEGMFWALLSIPFMVNAFMGSAVLRTFHRIKASMVALYIVFPLVMIITCSYYYWSNERMTVDAVLFIQLCIAVVTSWLVRRSVRRRIKNKLGGVTPQFKSWVWLKRGYFYYTGSVVDVLMRRSDIIILGFIISHVEAGYYAVAALVTSFVAFGLSVTDYVYLPKIKTAHESGKRKVVQSAVNQAARQILAMSLPIIVLLMFGGSWLLSCFGSQFSVAYVPMLILLAGQAVEATLGLSGNLLTMYNRHAVINRINGLCLFFQILLIILLTPYLGMTGAAMASTICRIATNIMAFNKAKKLIGIRASVI